MKGKFEDYIKAVRKGNREAVLQDEKGWKAVTKVFKSKKGYNRKKKHRESGGEEASI